MSADQTAPERFRKAEAKMRSLRPFRPTRPLRPADPLGKWPAADKDAWTNNICIAMAIYGWRRDYGEWPTWLNTVDRLAVELIASHEAAERRLAFALNDPTDAHYIYALHSADVGKALDGEEAQRVLDLWMATELTLYVPADFITTVNDVLYKLARNGIMAA